MRCHFTPSRRHREDTTTQLGFRVWGWRVSRLGFPCVSAWRSRRRDPKRRTLQPPHPKSERCRGVLALPHAIDRRATGEIDREEVIDRGF